MIFEDIEKKPELHMKRQVIFYPSYCLPKKLFIFLPELNPCNYLCFYMTNLT